MKFLKMIQYKEIVTYCIFRTIRHTRILDGKFGEEIFYILLSLTQTQQNAVSNEAFTGHNLPQNLHHYNDTHRLFSLFEVSAFTTRHLHYSQRHY